MRPPQRSYIALGWCVGRRGAGREGEGLTREAGGGVLMLCARARCTGCRIKKSSSNSQPAQPHSHVRLVVVGRGARGEGGVDRVGGPVAAFASSGRCKEDSFNHTSRSIARGRLPPCRHSCSRRLGGEKETRSIAGRGGGRGGIVRRGGGMNRVSCGRREGDSLDRASWPAPTALDNFERAPPRAFERLLGEGTQGERGGIVRIGGRGLEGDDGRDGNGFFPMRGACKYARVWGKTKPKAKFARCSRMGKLCPHATASPKSPPKNVEAADYCAIGAEWGGGGNEQNGQESAPPRPKSVSRFRASF